MTTAVLLALTGDDSELLRLLMAHGSGLQVERRCGDVAELLAAAAAGLGEVAVIDTELDGVDLTVLDRLRRASVQCLLLAPSQDVARWATLGVPVESRSATPQRLVEVLQSFKGLDSRAGEPEPSEDIWPFLETTAAPGTVPVPPPPPALQADPTAITPAEAVALDQVRDTAVLPWMPAIYGEWGWGPSAASGAETLGAAAGASDAAESGSGAGPGSLDTPRSQAAPDSATGAAALTAPGGPLSPGGPLTPSGLPVPGVPLRSGELPAVGDLPASGAAAAAAWRSAGTQGRIVAVWGPTGAPGRSTIAASLALGLRGAGEVLLVDADLEAPSLVQLLGMPEDSSALATAARLATHGGLDQPALAGLLTEVSPGVRLLSGLGRPGRWRELPPVSMDVVWSRCRETAAWTVVDLPGGLAEDEVNELTLEPGRGAVVAELLAQAEVVLVVGGADPIGVRRLLQLLADMHTQGWRGRLEVVVNRVRASAAGHSPKWAVREALERFGGLEKATLLPDDPALADRALLEGQAVLELAPASALGRALAELAATVDPAVASQLQEKARRRGRRPGPFSKRSPKARPVKGSRARPAKPTAMAGSNRPETADVNTAAARTAAPAAAPDTGSPAAVGAPGHAVPGVSTVAGGYGIMPAVAPASGPPEGRLAERTAPSGDTPRRRGGRHRR